MISKRTTTLIPTNGIHVTETFYPKGFQVARYDGAGLTSDLRWFPSQEKANAYARTLEA